MADGGRSIHPKALPNYQGAVIPENKLLRYALDPTHPRGRHKAIVFKSALGFDQSNWEILQRRILDELPYHEAVFEAENKDWGRAYHVDMPILGVNGSTQNVRTAWIIKHGDDHPSLVTPWVLP